MNNIADFTAAQRALVSAESILLTTHERTDGDDLGTVLALWHTLLLMGKRAHIAVRGGVPHNLLFLPGTDLVTETPPDTDFDLLVISGCSQRERIGNAAISELNVPIINFDHHPDNTFFGDINVVDHTKSAVAELLYDFFKFTGWKINLPAAKCMLTGIFTDTGSFMHSNTSSTTYKAAADLMRRGALVNKIAEHTFRAKNIPILRAWSKGLDNTVLNNKIQLIYSVITQEDLDALGNPPASAFEGFVETLNKVPEARYALFLKQDGPVVKGSLRSDPHKNIDVGKIARSMGGGGHKWASGFSIPGKIVRTATNVWDIEAI